MHHIPNALSFLRILLCPLTSYFFLKDKIYWGYFLIACAGLTDFLDGYLARFLNCSSSFGALLDPIADKIFMFGLLLIFFYKGWIPLWFLILVTLRDLLILAGGYFFINASISMDMSPSVISKWNTALLFLFLFFAHTSKSWILMLIITITTLLSGGDYVQRAIKAYTRS
jgi:cardiolipin synthase